MHGLSSGFDLPDGSFRQPDAAWISTERLAAGKSADGEASLSVAPDFVAEIRSDSDRLKKLQTKMTEGWIANGVRLAWLIDPFEEKTIPIAPVAPWKSWKVFRAKRSPARPFCPALNCLSTKCGGERDLSLFRYPLKRHQAATPVAA